MLLSSYVVIELLNLKGYVFDFIIYNLLTP